MQPIALQATPKQTTNFVADNQQYKIRVWFDGDDLMLMDVYVNGTLIVASCTCLVGQMVIPFAYLEGAGGNFFWTTASGDNPNYQNFGNYDVLLYASNAEMSAQRAAIAASATTITLAQNQAA